MSILVDRNSKVVVQGITGKEGSFHTHEMISYGTKVVAGVTPGKGGQSIFDIPIFNTVRDAVIKTGADTSIIFVPAFMAKDAVLEAIYAGIKVIAFITDGVPVNDMLVVKEIASRNQVIMIGPNCPGVISPGKCKLGIMPGNIFKEGNLGVISRSGTLTYEIVDELTRFGLGQSTCIGIGGDPIIGTSFLDAVKLFHKDSQTRAIVLVGEIGGTQEEEAAEYIKEHKIPAVAFIAGRTAPPGKRMGHAGAIVSGKKGTAQSKIEALKNAGIKIADTTFEIPALVKEILAGELVR